MSQIPPPIPSAAAPGTLSYATPFANQSPGIWREGHLLIVPKEVQLPDRCVKCNAPGDGRPMRRALYWHAPWWYLLILFPGLLIYAIVALCIRQKATVVLALCAGHRKSRRLKLAVAWVVGLLGLTGFIGGIFLLSDRNTEDIGAMALIGGLVLALLGLVLGVIFSGILSPAKMDGPYAWLKGACSDYLATFPPAR